MLIAYFFLKTDKSKAVNPCVDKDKNPPVEKVITNQKLADIEDIIKKSDPHGPGGQKCAICRCWRSKNFPWCDGSHNAYNKECGDNTGPLVIK